MLVLRFANVYLAALVICIALLFSPTSAAPLKVNHHNNLHRRCTPKSTAATPTDVPDRAVSASVGAPTPSSSAAHHSQSAGSGSASASASAPSATGNSSPSSSGSGPRFVVYTDSYIPGGNGLPSPADIHGFNVLALSFLLTSGAADQAEQWASLSASERASAKKAYNDAGIKLIVSAFGSTDAPTTAGADPVKTAKTMAAWVKKYDMDGIDVDYEDFDALNGGKGAEKWLETFTKTLRAQLPSGQYTISHAPVAPWFQPKAWSGGGYLAIDKSVGDLIDWYNVQFYNQGADMYTDCNGLLTKSGSAFPGTSVFEINKNGVPLDKIVIGKPGVASDAANGFIAQPQLSKCVSQAQQKGWNAGVMSWEYPHAEAKWIKTVRGSVYPL